MKQFVLKSISPNDNSWWISDIDGDPGRTTIKTNAKFYMTAHSANLARAYYVRRYSHIRKIELSVEDVDVSPENFIFYKVAILPDATPNGNLYIGTDSGTSRAPGIATRFFVYVTSGKRGRRLTPDEVNDEILAQAVFI